MNELSKLFLDVNNGETVTLEKDRIYNVRQDDSVTLDGYFCSNTAKQHENPNGTRYTAIYLKEKKNITLEVKKDNKSAISLYLKNGFKKTAIRKGYYKGIDGILMERKKDSN